MKLITAIITQIIDESDVGWEIQRADGTFIDPMSFSVNYWAFSNDFNKKGLTWRIFEESGDFEGTS